MTHTLNRSNHVRVWIAAVKTKTSNMNHSPIAMSLKLTAIRIYKNIVIRLTLIFNPIWHITDDDYISIKDQLLIIYIFEFEIGLYC